MTRVFTLTAGVLLAAALAGAQTEPQPKPIDPGDATRPPSDAIVLFNGKDMSGWHIADGSPARCSVADGAIACRSGAGDIYSETKFQSVQLHLEFLVPSMPDQTGQLRGNSGVYLQGRYEIQILDSYGNPTYPTGALGALYGQSAPLVNAARPPGEWQSYDIVFHAPRCDDDRHIVEKASVTVLLNGVLVQDHVRIEASAACEPGPLMLQDHSGFEGAPVTEMRFRNLWLRPLD
jgi:hypothetical protein